VNNRIIRVRAVPDDGHRRVIDASTILVDDEVSLEPIRQREDHLTTVGVQIDGIHEDVLFEAAAGEVKASPVGAECRATPLDCPVVSRHGGIAEAEAPRASDFDVAGAVDS